MVLVFVYFPCVVLSYYFLGIKPNSPNNPNNTNNTNNLITLITLGSLPGCFFVDAVVWQAGYVKVNFSINNAMV